MKYVNQPVQKSDAMALVTGKDRFLIHQHRTETTVCCLTASLDTVTAFFPQKIDQEHSRIDFFLTLYSIQPEFNIHPSFPLLLPRLFS